MATKNMPTSSHSVKMHQRKTELNGSSHGAAGRYSIRSTARKAITAGGRRKIQIYELKNEKKRTIFDETIILTVEYDKINVIKIRRVIVYPSDSKL